MELSQETNLKKRELEQRLEGARNNRLRITGDIICLPSNVSRADYRSCLTPSEMRVLEKNADFLAAEFEVRDLVKDLARLRQTARDESALNQPPSPPPPVLPRPNMELVSESTAVTSGSHPGGTAHNDATR